MVGGLAWHRALSALKWSPTTETAKAGWPETFSIDEVSRLQYPNDTESRRILANALLTDIEAGTLEADYRDKRTAYTADCGVVVIDLSSPFYVHPLPLIDWLNTNSETPSEHIKNWAEQQAEAVGGGDSAQTKELREQAWLLGNTWMIEQREMNNSPGVNAIAQHVEGKFKGLDIRGVRGDYLDWQTIKKFLTGITGKSANGK